VNFVLMNQGLDSKVRHHLEGSQFNLTTLNRLITTKELQEKVGLALVGGELCSDKKEAWVQEVLTDVVTIIATGKKNGEKWTEREVDTAEKRETFAEYIVDVHPGAKKASNKWIVSGSPKVMPAAQKTTQSNTTPSTEDQVNLIPKHFKMELPAGKINDIFIELKKLDVVTYRHAVSVLFRVFFEFTLDEFIKKRNIQLPKDKQGHVNDKLSVRLGHVLKDVKATKLLSDKELKPVNVAVSDTDSLLAPDTLNSYVHSKWMNPDPLRLKLTWANVQLFVERLWTVK